MRKGDKRKADIVRVAGELFTQKGYRKTTLNDIIEVLGCSKGSFYHHFESKLSVLQALAGRRVMSDREAYEQALPDDALEALNRLLRFSSPFRSGEESFLAAQLSLRLQEEGATLTMHLRKARKEAFFPELCRLLGRLREEDRAHFQSVSQIELLWETHQAFLESILQESCRVLTSGATPASRWIDLLAAARFHWERLLDLPFGSVVLVEAEELTALLERTCELVRLEEEQLRIDPSPASL